MKSNLPEKANQADFAQKENERKERLKQISQIVSQNESQFVRALKNMIKKDL